MENLYQKITSFDLKSILLKWIHSVTPPFWLSLITAFLTLNLIFSYHGAHFLFGDHDWKYIKNGVSLSAGLFEGRFTQFLLINALTNGEILPILNNTFGFFGFSLGITLLATYWQLPRTKTAYLLFTLFTITTPYILSFMYFAFLIPPVLSWNAVVVTALLISEKETSFSPKKTLISTLLITISLGGYPPVINLIGTAFAARLLIACATAKNCPNFLSLVYTFRHTVINIILGLILYKLCLIYLTKTGSINPNYYNLQTISPAEYPQKFLLIVKDIITQFFVTLPFISITYKHLAAALVLLSVLALIFRVKTLRGQKNNSALISLTVLFFLSVWLTPMVTLFLSPSLEQTEFSPRIDFFGFIYALSAMFALTLISSAKIIKNISFLIAIILIYTNITALYEAQKVWHLGFKAELLLYRRVIKRFESDPLFNQNARYIIVQGGSPAFRSKYYHTPYTRSSDDLLDISYVPGMNSAVMWNYASPVPYADTVSYVYTFTPDTNFLSRLKSVSPWPSPNSISVGGYWILLPLTQEGLFQLRTRYLSPQP